MRCYKHETEEVVGTCDCGLGLCHECAELFKPLVCGNCAAAYLADRRATLLGHFTITGGLFLVGLCFVLLASLESPREAMLGLLA